MSSVRSALEAFRRPVMPELMASLRVAAADGTLRKRLKTADVAGQAHIKTGSLVGVGSIAGYVLDARGRRVVVVFIVNHPNAGNSQAAEDALLRWVRDHPSPQSGERVHYGRYCSGCGLVRRGVPRFSDKGSQCAVRL